MLARKWTASSGLVAAAGLIIAGALATGCAAPTRAQLVSEPGCADSSFQIYFAEQSAVVSRAARRVIADTTAQVKACHVASVDVVGLADYRGPADANLSLSRARAEAVAAALAKSGLPAPQFRVEAAGDAGAVTQKGQIEPLRRRADIFIRYAR